MVNGHGHIHAYMCAHFPSLSCVMPYRFFTVQASHITRVDTEKHHNTHAAFARILILTIKISFSKLESVIIPRGIDRCQHK